MDVKHKSKKSMVSVINNVDDQLGISSFYLYFPFDIFYMSVSVFSPRFWEISERAEIQHDDKKLRYFVSFVRNGDFFQGRSQ